MPKRRDPPPGAVVSTVPWERRQSETDRAWHAFTVYRDMGKDRTLAKVAASPGVTQKSASTIQALAAKQDWTWRAAQYDIHLDRQAQAEAVEAVRRQARERANLAQGMVRIAGLSLQQWGRRLARFERDVAADPENGDRAKPPLGARETKDLAEAGIKLALLLEGRATDVVDVRAGEMGEAEKADRLRAFLAHPQIRSTISIVEADAKKER